MDFSKKTIWIVWLSHNFENCPSMIFPSKLLEPAKQAVTSPSSSDANIMVSICNVNFTYYFNIVFYIWYYAFEKNIIEYFGLYSAALA